MSEKVAVLLVDDRPENLVALEAVLDGMGLDLVKAKSANDALKFSLKQDFALVLMDVQMPGMSGFEAAELMRSNPKTSHLPIIFVTAGMNDVQLQFKGYELGAVDYLIKPFEPYLLRSKVEVFCELYRYHRQQQHAHQGRLINTMREGYAHCRILYDNSSAIDFVFLTVNAAFESLTGLVNVIDRKASEAIPGLIEATPEMFATFERVAATGNPEIIESYVEPLKRWFSLSVYSMEKEYFVTVFQNITERKQAEHCIRDNEAKFRLLFETSSDGIHVMDMDGNLVEANNAFYRMLGYRREEAAGLNVSDWAKQFSREEFQARFKSHIGKNLRVETQHRRKDGSLLDVEISVTGVNLDDKNYVIAASRDITERKKAELILRQCKLVIDSINDGYWINDMDGNLREVNAAYAKLTGYSIDELLQMHISQLDVIDRPEDVAARAPKIIQLGHDRFETRHRRKDGQEIDIEISITYLPESQRFAVFSHDISERKRAENILKLNKIILDTASEGFWMADLQGRLLEVNQAYADMIGYTREELVGKRIAEISLSANSQQQVMANISRSIELGHTSFETHHRHKDGHVIEFAASLTYMKEVQCLYCFLRDVTESKRAEDEIRVAAVAFETHDAILITDAKANIIRVNQAFTDITGYSQEEVLGQNPRMMSSGRQDKTFYTEMWQQLLHTGSWAGDILDKRKNGQIYPKWLTITAVKNERQEATHYVAIFSDITARKRAEEEIRNLAFYDALTKLPNRRLFMDRFRAALSISTRRNDYGAVLFIDLDRFKTLNDTLGHDYGDLLLIEVAARIKSCVREMDTVARLGGDEFVVLIEGISEDQDETSRKVGFIAEKIRETLAQPYMLKSHEHNSSPSIGLCLYRGNEKTIDDLIQQADMAMYQAKNAGRNAVRFFDPLMQQNVASRAALENDLYHAIALGQLQLYYQVQVDEGHRPVGAEVLLRWNHPERGVVMPIQFISVAEESTLILDIGNWVLNQASRQLAMWAKDEHMCDLTLAVNVSAKQFAQANFVDIVAGLVKSYQIASSKLKLELTESMLLHDLKNTIDTMHALKKLGVKLSMDDFGTGYSSLSYLRELPLDQIKIDQSFIQNITRDGNDALLVQTIINLGGNFHMNVIAEGVETEAQLAFLKHHDCLDYQGFLFGKPLPIGEFEKLLEDM